MAGAGFGPPRRHPDTLITPLYLYLDPATLEGQQLVLHRVGVNDFADGVADHAAGRIMARSVSGSRVLWFWTLTGPYMPSHLQPSNGDADSLLQAKAAFGAKFDA